VVGLRGGEGKGGDMACCSLVAIGSSA